MVKILHAMVLLHENGDIRLLPYKRIRISPNGIPCISYNNRCYEVKSGYFNTKQRSYKKLDCSIFWNEDHYDERMIELMHFINKVDNYKFISEEEFQKVRPKINKIKYIYVFVDIPEHGKKELPLSISPEKGKASVIFDGIGYEILNKMKTYDGKDSKGFFTEKHRKRGNVQLALALKKFRYRTKFMKKLIDTDSRIIKEDSKPRIIKLSGKFN